LYSQPSLYGHVWTDSCSRQEFDKSTEQLELRRSNPLEKSAAVVFAAVDIVRNKTRQWLHELTRLVGEVRTGFGYRSFLDGKAFLLLSLLQAKLSST